MKNVKILGKSISGIALLLFSLLLVGTAAAAWYTFTYDYSQSVIDHIDRTTPFTLENEPNNPQYLDEPTMEIVGSGYVGLSHDVHLSISHHKPEIDAWNYYLLTANVDAHLDETGEVIAAYLITDLPAATVHEYAGTWTPTSPVGNYILHLSVSGYTWTLRRDATYAESDIVFTLLPDTADVYLQDTVFTSSIVQVGGTVELGFNYRITFPKSTAEYRILDNGVEVAPWTDIGSEPYTAATYPITESWTVSGSGVHIVEIQGRATN